MVASCTFQVIFCPFPEIFFELLDPSFWKQNMKCILKNIILHFRLIIPKNKKKMQNTTEKCKKQYPPSLRLKLLLTKSWKSKQYSVIKIQPKSSEFDIFLWAGPKKKGTFFFVIISLTALFNMQFFYRSILIVVGLLG